MRLDDIEKFKGKENCYHVNYGIVGYMKWIEEEMRDFGLELNPDFQRGHVWKEEQQVKYMEFLLKNGVSGRTFYYNCPKGAYNKETAGNLYVCVDGLQRTTAIRRFLNNEIKVFGHYYSEYEPLSRMEITIEVYINDLRTKREIMEWYLEFNDGGTVHTAEEIERVRKMVEEERSL